ncbi:MAG: hypothetical protein AABW65_01265 [Nanoarchaeota archaeon]
MEQYRKIIESDNQITTREVFNRLAYDWKVSTGMLSITTQKYKHPSYQSILSLKRNNVIPLILEELRQRPDWWFNALETLTKQNPVKAGANFEEAINSWIKWGKQNNYIE